MRRWHSGRATRRRTAPRRRPPRAAAGRVRRARARRWNGSGCGSGAFMAPVAPMARAPASLRRSRRRDGVEHRVALVLDMGAQQPARAPARRAPRAARPSASCSAPRASTSPRRSSSGSAGAGCGALTVRVESASAPIARRAHDALVDRRVQAVVVGRSRRAWQASISKCRARISRHLRRRCACGQASSPDNALEPADHLEGLGGCRPPTAATTTAPRLGSSSTRPSAASSRNASRSGVRDTRSGSPSARSLSRVPGGKLALGDELAQRRCDPRGQGAVAAGPGGR